MTTLTEIAERYVAAWNETEPRARRARVAEAWTAAGHYLDPLMEGRGHDGIDGMIAGVQARFPGLRFRLSGEPDGFGDLLRFSWELGPEGSEALVRGTDFAVVEEGRLKSVNVFLDKVPAGR